MSMVSWFFFLIFLVLELSFPNLFNYFPNLNSLSLPTGCAQNILIWSLLVQHSVQQLLIGYPILSYSYPIKHQLYYYPINLLPILLIVLPIPGKILDPYNNFWIYPPCPPKYIIVWGIGVVPNNFFFIGILIFLLLRSPCKIWEPYDNSLLEI